MVCIYMQPQHAQSDVCVVIAFSGHAYAVAVALQLHSCVQLWHCLPCAAAACRPTCCPDAAMAEEHHRRQLTRLLLLLGVQQLLILQLLVHV
jgi:hypothetical protein